MQCRGWASVALLVFVLAGWRAGPASATCVWDSDFGFTLNCGFKKSGIFRVRNLGGVKGYLGLGFSVGDELGFPQSLSTEDNAKRRSTKAAAPAAAPAPDKTTNELGVQTVTTVNGVSKGARSMSRAAPIPPFKPILPAARPPPPTLEQYRLQQAQPHLLAAPAIMVSGNSSSRPSRLAYVGPAQGVEVVPPFQALPSSITRLSPAPAPAPAVGVHVVPAPQAFRNSLTAATNRFQVRQDTVAPGPDPGLASNSLALRSGPSALPPLQDPPLAQIVVKPEDSVMGHSIKALAKASNLSVEAITAAIAVRQQQLLKQQQQAMLAAEPAAAAAPVSVAPPSGGPKKYALSGVNKVMNAPKEYYPVGYDKNFDDNFASRVELPDTSFYCGDQKHFPGLYSDEDLGCMVFHVCAFTDDGLIMKSFLCPESTLFDQTILKCNWWFYVDCKSSKKLYDSNIPISKSYQLMKALAFFSAYKKS